MSSLNDVFQQLGLNSSNGLYFFEDKWADQVKISGYIKRIFEKKLNPTAFFCFDSKPLILFFENPPDNKDLHRKIWNFNGAPIIIIVKDAVVEIFNGFKLSDQNNGFLDQIGGNEVLNNFSYFELVTGKTWEKYQNQLSYKNRVDYMLLKNIRDAREKIISKFQKTQSKTRKKTYAKITNALLGKIIFTRYLIDRGVKLQFENNPKNWNNADLCNLLKNQRKTKQFFDYLADPNEGFNGDLFPLTPEDYSEIPKEAYNEIIQLLKSNDVGTGQLSFFDMYDFSIIPIEFISNIYESFVRQENQEKEGVYYTPLFLVDYILSETVSKEIETTQNTDCKVLDPACGSGVFLVESLRKIIEKYIEPVAKVLNRGNIGGI
jgi:type I restriction-modification system DNA methylase subunit